VIAGFVSISFLERSEISRTESTLAKEVGQGFADALNMAARGGAGFTYTYRFQKTVSAREYEIVFDTTRDPAHPQIAINWMGGYGTDTYLYPLVPYDYRIDTASRGCISSSTNPPKLSSNNNCRNQITLANDGNTVTILQVSYYG